MEPTLKNLSAFAVSGITVRTINRDEANPETAKLPGHWGRFFAEGLAEKIPHRLPDSPVYGVYSSYESDVTGHYNLTAGVAVSESPEHSEFTAVGIEAGHYLVFEAKGPMPQVVVETWGAIWRFFQDHPDVKRQYTTDFEAYQGPDEIAIHIAVNQ